jgi:uncharacterized repeat protein (TIGR02543 family)
MKHFNNTIQKKEEKGFSKSVIITVNIVIIIIFLLLLLFLTLCNKKITLTFDSKGGTEIESIIQEKGSEIEPPLIPSLPGYNFEGWFKDEDLTVPFDFTVMPDKDTTVYAKWTPRNYTVTFNSDGGSAVASQTAPYGSALTAPEAPARAGYQFLKWICEPDTASWNSQP